MVTIEAATIEGVNYVNRRMSSLDLLEIGAISFTEDPEIIGQQLFQMCENGYAWIFSRDGKPEAFYGCHEGIPGIWFVCGFRTDDFHKVKFTVSKFIKKRIIPILMGQGARKAISLVRGQGNEWLQMLGAKPLVTYKDWGKDGSDYTLLCWDRKDFLNECSQRYVGIKQDEGTETTKTSRP